MDDNYIGEIRYVGFSYAPQGWALCNGQVLPIQQNTALFSLLGTTFGGDGVRTFALPDLRGRIAVGQGQGPGLSSYQLGQNGGAEAVALSRDQIAPHTHGVAGSGNLGTTADPTQGVFAQPRVGRGTANLYDSTTTGQASTNAIGQAGGGLTHENRAAGLAVTGIIALTGIYPQRP